jgi:SPP1 family phage portal protein
MPYYTQTEIVNLKVLADAAISDSKVMKDLIDADYNSQLKKWMRLGENYYNGNHDYQQHKNYYWASEGKQIEAKTRANNLIISSYYTFGEDQKIEYLLGKPPTVGVDEPYIEDEDNPTPEEKKAIKRAEKFQTAINKELGRKFVNTLTECAHGASRKAIEWLHFYVNTNSELEFVIVPSQQIIPIYDVQYENRLIQIIRYYEYQLVDTNNKQRVTRYKVEVWTEKDVTYYAQDYAGDFYLDLYYQINPSSHWYDENEALKTKKAQSWGRLPFVPIYNNSQGTSDLRPIKPLLDAYDKVFSGWANDLDDIKQLILVLKGYNGLSNATKSGLTELEYFLQTLYTYGAIPVSDNGGVDNLKNEIPVDARERFLKICKEAIFEIGRMVETSKLVGGDITNVAIKSHYAGLDMKANAMITLLHESLEEIMYFVVSWMNRRDKTDYDYKDIRFTFNKTMLFNELEQTTKMSMVADRISEKTFLENLPFIDDADEEIARIEADKKRKTDDNMVRLDNIPDENYYDKDGKIITDKNYTGKLYDPEGNEIQVTNA